MSGKKEPTIFEIAAAMASQAEQEDQIMIFRTRAREWRMKCAIAQEQIKQLTARIAELEAPRSVAELEAKILRD